MNTRIRQNKEWNKSASPGMYMIHKKSVKENGWIVTPEIYKAAAAYADQCKSGDEKYIGLTHALETFLMVLQKEAAPKEIQLVAEDIFNNLSVSTFYLNNYPRGAARARASHKLFDATLESGKPVAVSCKKGCAACCHWPLDITNDEADLMASLVGVETHAALIKWKETPPDRSGNRCLFLSTDNVCTIYDHRPLVCRKHAVTSHPGYCKESNGKIKQVLNIPQEIIVSAAINCKQSHIESMPLAMARALAKDATITGDEPYDAFHASPASSPYAFR